MKTCDLILDDLSPGLSGPAKKATSGILSGIFLINEWNDRHRVKLLNI